MSFQTCQPPENNLKSGDRLFCRTLQTSTTPFLPPFTLPPPPPTQIDPVPNYNTLGWLGTLYKVLHEIQTIKICFFDEMVSSEMKIRPKKTWKPYYDQKRFKVLGVID